MHVHMKANKPWILSCKLLSCDNKIPSANNPVWESVEGQGSDKWAHLMSQTQHHTSSSFHSQIIYSKTIDLMALFEEGD